MPQEPTHKLYVDESGTKDYAADGTYVIGSGPTPYFVFAGLLLTPADAGVVAANLRALKKTCFGTENVEIKANWLRRKEERRKRYHAKFGTDDARLERFTDEIYQLIVDTKCSLFAAVVAKAEVQQKYAARAWHPAAIAYECLAQRVHWEMCNRDGLVHVTIDDMEGATPAGNQHLKNLKIQHEQLTKLGSPLQRRAFRLDRLAPKLDAMKSHDDERLQLADLVAYAAYRQFIDHAAAWEDGKKDLPLYEYMARLGKKFCCDSNGVIAGFGLVKFPSAARVLWGMGAQENEP